MKKLQFMQSMNRLESSGLTSLELEFLFKTGKWIWVLFCSDTSLQERIAYQKLLKDFNRMEAATENLQDEVKNLPLLRELNEC